MLVLLFSSNGQPATSDVSMGLEASVVVTGAIVVTLDCVTAAALVVVVVVVVAAAVTLANVVVGDWLIVMVDTLLIAASDSIGRLVLEVFAINACGPLIMIPVTISVSRT